MLFKPILLSGLVALASAKKAPALSAITKTLVSKCMTASGPQSVATLATSNKAVKLTTTITSMSTSTPSTTVTPEPYIDFTVECSTSTITETASQETDTCIITTILVETETSWESSTAYETEWSTLTEYSTTTPTIMPSAGYTPIHSEIYGKGKTPAKRDADSVLFARAEENSLKIQNDKIVLPPSKFPVRVQCINVVYITYIKVQIVTASETSTITAPTPTKSVTSTHIVEETVTEAVVDATTTSIVSETSTISLTSTHWETTTVVSSTTTTSVVPAATPYYAACAAENILTSVSGTGINRVVLTPKQNFVAVENTGSAYDCCVASIQGEYAGSIFRPKDAMCYVLSAPGACDATAKSFGLFAAKAQTPSGGFVVSNGNCGSGRLMNK